MNLANSIRRSECAVVVRFIAERTVLNCSAKTHGKRLNTQSRLPNCVNELENSFRIPSLVSLVRSGFSLFLSVFLRVHFSSSQDSLVL